VPQEIRLTGSIAREVWAKRQNFGGYRHCGKLLDANKNDMKDGPAPHEVRHALIDYRNENEVLAIKTLSRQKAWELNRRLKGSGFAWSVKTGY